MHTTSHSILLTLLLCLLSPMTQAAERVLMIVPDGSRDLELMLEAEVGTMRRMLGEAGYDIDIATATMPASCCPAWRLPPEPRNRR